MNNKRLSSLENKVLSFVIGWSNSRRKGTVDVTKRNGSVECTFEVPIGRIKRQHEIFFWDTKTIDPSKIRSNYSNSKHFVTLFNVNQLNDKVMKSNGYNEVTDELFMYLDLSTLPTQKPSPLVRKIAQPEEMEWFNRQRLGDTLSFEQLKNDGITIYYVCEGEQLASWARAIQVDQVMVLDDVVTQPEFRRRGLSKQILTQILMDTQRAGKTQIVVLAASELGQKLYQKMGFENIAKMGVYSS